MGQGSLEVDLYHSVEHYHTRCRHPGNTLLEYEHLATRCLNIRFWCYEYKPMDSLGLFREIRRVGGKRSLA